MAEWLGQRTQDLDFHSSCVKAWTNCSFHTICPEAVKSNWWNKSWTESSVSCWKKYRNLLGEMRLYYREWGNCKVLESSDMDFSNTFTLIFIQCINMPIEDWLLLPSTLWTVKVFPQRVQFSFGHTHELSFIAAVHISEDKKVYTLILKFVKSVSFLGGHLSGCVIW